jgi:hypothetical protein
MTSSIPPISRVLVGDLYKNNSTGNIYKIRCISFWAKDNIGAEIPMGTSIVTFSPENSSDCYSTEENDFYSRPSREGQWLWTKVEPVKEVNPSDSSAEPTRKEWYERPVPVKGDSYEHRITGYIYKVAAVYGRNAQRQQVVILYRYGGNPKKIIFVEEEEFHFKTIHEGKLDWDWVKVEKIKNESNGW